MINAENFGIIPEKEISQDLVKMFIYIRENNCHEVIFQKGTYYIDSDECQKYMLYITNTVGDDEFSSDEVPHLNTVAIYLEKIKNLTLDGNGSVFVINGKATNMAIRECENITVKNLEIRHSHPDMHMLTVKSKGAFFVDFTVDPDTEIVFRNNKPYFSGKDYFYPADKSAASARWIPLVKKGDTDFACRTRHPLFGAVKYRETENGFRAYYPITLRFSLGDSFHIYDVRRQFVGIFVEKSKNVRFFNIKQRFNYSLALVAQCSSDISLENSVFAPEENAVRLISSCADFVQANMCRGKVSVTNCIFKGAGDDCANFHGVHLKVVQANGNALTVRFMHPQTHGFDPYLPKDEVTFIDPDTLTESGRAKVISSDLISETDIVLTLDRQCEGKIGAVIENLSAMPDVLFADNELSRIVTRGVLLTVGGKSRILRNKFAGTAMSGILISNDAKSWYESGRCRDVLIDGNNFIGYGENAILISPENKTYRAAVHENIRICNNRFDGSQALRAHSVDSLVFSGNVGKGCKNVQVKNCKNSDIK